MASDEYCNRCGEPLPVDRRYDCEGDPDRDQVVALRGLKTNRVYTLKGMRRTYETDGKGSIQ